MGFRKSFQLFTAILLLGGFIGWFVYYDLQYITAYGKVTGRHIRNFSLPFSAAVEKVYVTEGETIEAGTPLLSLSLDEVLLRQKQLEYEIRKTLTEIEQEKAQISRLRSDKSYSVRMLQRYEQLLERENVLLKSGVIAPASIEHYQDTLNYYRKEQNDISTLIGTKTGKYANIDLFEHKIKVLRGELDKINSQFRMHSISGSSIVSPVKNGVVCEVNIKPGDIAGMDKPAVSILDLDSLIITGQVPEKVIRFVEPGAPVKVILRSDYWKRQRGKVRSRSQMAFQEHGNAFFKVEIDLDNASSYMLPNCNVVLKIRRKGGLRNLFAM